MKKKIQKSKIRWIITDDYVVALGSLQATIYYVYDLTNRIPFDRMKKKIIKSKPEEYNTWTDVIDLATKHGIIGHNAKFRQEWFES